MTAAPPAGAGPFEGICYEDALPLDFRRDALPEGAALAGLNADNIQLLIADASLDEARVHSGDGKSKSKGDDDGPLAEDLHRLEHKVNVLIQLVAKLVARDQSQPEPVAWRFYAGGIEWQGPAIGAAVGETGIVRVFVSRLFPQPLRLPVRVVAARRDATGDWQRAVFEQLSPAVTDGIERMIFRHHRRAVAGVRAHPRD